MEQSDKQVSQTKRQKTDAAPDLRERFLRLAISEIGECLTDLGTILLQGLTEGNEAKRGGIALGLERAAQYVRGKSMSEKYPAGFRALDE